MGNLYSFAHAWNVFTLVPHLCLLEFSSLFYGQLGDTVDRAQGWESRWVWVQICPQTLNSCATLGKSAKMTPSSSLHALWHHLVAISILSVSIGHWFSVCLGSQDQKGWRFKTLRRTLWKHYTITKRNILKLQKRDSQELWIIFFLCVFSEP